MEQAESPSVSGETMRCPENEQQVPPAPALTLGAAAPRVGAVRMMRGRFLPGLLLEGSLSSFELGAAGGERFLGELLGECQGTMVRAVGCEALLKGGAEGQTFVLASSTR